MDSRVTELHCIMPIANIPSVLANGILSHERVSKLPHKSVAAQVVQDKRDLVQVPGGLKLHQYANLYFNARNPMMYLRRGHVGQLCVLRIDVGVLRTRGAVISDCNASSNYVRFLAPAQHGELVFDDIFAKNWTHPGDPIRYLQHKSRMCAEALIPHVIPTAVLRGAYVLNDPVARTLTAQGFTLPITRNPNIFFC